MKNIMSRKMFSYAQPLSKTCVNRSSTVKKKVNLFSLSGHRSIGVIYHLGIHTSPIRKAPSPGLWEILLNIIRMVGVSYARNMKGLPEGPKFRSGTVAAAGVVTSVLGYIFYVTHLEECPITKRKKFVVFSDKYIRQMAKQESENIRRHYHGKVKRSGEEYQNASGISSRILKANRHLPGIKRDWSVFIIEDKRIQNAFVLPNGDIFVFTGMIYAVSNEDQLAAVMGHEIAHALLNHAGELISKTHLFEFLLLLPIILLWMVLPDAAAVLSQDMARYVSEIMFKLPMSRQLETEADVVGLQMMARACYDPRQAVELWRRMAKLSQGEKIEWLSTHPSHQTRYKTLETLMPEALAIYSRHCKT